MESPQIQRNLLSPLCAANAAGETIPPMHIFSGVRFKSNPMEGAVDNAYFGRSPNGWIIIELFYGWLQIILLSGLNTAQWYS